MFWTDDELDFLSELIAKKISIRAISILLRKTEYDVRSRLKQDGISYFTRHAWSREETGILDQWAEVLPVEMIAKKLPNRSTIAVKARLFRLGYSTKTYWDYWRISTCSELTGIKESTIYRWISNGLLRYTKIPERKGCFVRKNDFLNFYWEQRDRLLALQKVSPEIISWLQEYEAS